MSTETMQWLNQNTLIGYSDQRGHAWHYRASDQGDEPNHYPVPVPEPMPDILSTFLVYLVDKPTRQAHTRPMRPTDPKGSTMSNTPAFVHHLCTTNDTKGNPRRGYAIYSAEGRILDFINEGYHGQPAWTRELVELPMISVTPVQYRLALKTWVAFADCPA
jgi:hypothetical protein